MLEIIFLLAYGKSWTYTGFLGCSSECLWWLGGFGVRSCWGELLAGSFSWWEEDSALHSGVVSSLTLCVLGSAWGQNLYTPVPDQTRVTSCGAKEESKL